jgi:hypothetical protein
MDCHTSGVKVHWNDLRTYCNENRVYGISRLNSAFELQSAGPAWYEVMSGLP